MERVLALITSIHPYMAASSDVSNLEAEIAVLNAQLRRLTDALRAERAAREESELNLNAAKEARLDEEHRHFAFSYANVMNGNGWASRSNKMEEKLRLVVSMLLEERERVQELEEAIESVRLLLVCAAL